MITPFRAPPPSKAHRRLGQPLYINLYIWKIPSGPVYKPVQVKDSLNSTNVEEPKEKRNGGHMAATQPTLVMITACLLILFFHWF
ncbi:hypothetical protein I3842_03G168400 [Carya illinoinensis]|uniref:Uncharacterized protein n=1 Tax=Carya illinoinensis TaxID=32201 RepID=A0A922JZ28_CARIL|nr:hypothetical protein I3842_03G168400 [Carya illinoinensis]